MKVKIFQTRCFCSAHWPDDRTFFQIGCFILVCKSASRFAHASTALCLESIHSGSSIGGFIICGAIRSKCSRTVMETPEVFPASIFPSLWILGPEIQQLDACAHEWRHLNWALASRYIRCNIEAKHLYSSLSILVSAHIHTFDKFGHIIKCWVLSIITWCFFVG